VVQVDAARSARVGDPVTGQWLRAVHARGERPALRPAWRQSGGQGGRIPIDPYPTADRGRERQGQHDADRPPSPIQELAQAAGQPVRDLPDLAALVLREDV
jgi:hypothetical protein